MNEEATFAVSGRLECPSCSGTGILHGLGCGDSGCRPMTLPCGRCDGAGTVPAEMERWIADGRVLRERRVGKPGEARSYRTLRDEARLLGISPVQLSRWEQGIEPGGNTLLAKDRP